MTTAQRSFEGDRDQRAGFYTWKNRDYVSVTTAIGVIDKPALRRWMAKMVAEKAVEMTQDGELARTLERFGTESTVDLLKGSPFGSTEKKANVGTAVHKHVEAIILGTPLPEPAAELKPFLRSFDAFVADNDVTFEAAEATVYSNTHGYAGTLDIILSQNGKRYLFDVKTGKGVYPEVALQLAAYRHADFIGLDDGSEHAIPTIDGTCVLHLRPRGYKIVDVWTEASVFVAFRAALALWRFQRETAPNVLANRSQTLIRPA